MLRLKVLSPYVGRGIILQCGPSMNSRGGGTEIQVVPGATN